MKIEVPLKTVEIQISLYEDSEIIEIEGKFVSFNLHEADKITITVHDEDNEEHTFVVHFSEAKNNLTFKLEDEVDGNKNEFDAVFEPL